MRLMPRPWSIYRSVKVDIPCCSSPPSLSSEETASSRQISIPCCSSPPSLSSEETASSRQISRTLLPPATPCLLPPSSRRSLSLSKYLCAHVVDLSTSSTWRKHSLQTGGRASTTFLPSTIEFTTRKSLRVGTVRSVRHRYCSVPFDVNSSSQTTHATVNEGVVMDDEDEGRSRLMSILLSQWEGEIRFDEKLEATPDTRRRGHTSLCVLAPPSTYTSISNALLEFGNKHTLVLIGTWG